MTAIQVTVWLSEAGNYHATQEAAEADTIERLFKEAGAPEEIEAVARAIHEAMGDNDVSDMGTYEWDELAAQNGGWLGEGQKYFLALAQAALKAVE